MVTAGQLNVTRQYAQYAHCQFPNFVHEKQVVVIGKEMNQVAKILVMIIMGVIDPINSDLFKRMSLPIEYWTTRIERTDAFKTKIECASNCLAREVFLFRINKRLHCS